MPSECSKMKPLFFHDDRDIKWMQVSYEVPLTTHYGRFGDKNHPFLPYFSAISF